MAVDSLDSNLEATRRPPDQKYVGTVVQNRDPLNLDRIQVRIPGLYDPDQGEVPWCGPHKDSPFGTAQNWGVYGVPAIGSDVVVELQNGDPHYPVYSSIMRYANPDFPSGGAWGFKDPRGNRLKVDLDANTVTFNSGTNVVFHIDAQGNLSVSVPGTTTITSEKTMTLVSHQDMSLHADGNMDISSGGTMTLNAGGAYSLTAPTIHNSGTITNDGNTQNNGNVNTNGNVSNSGSLTNNGKNVGSTHTHGGVDRGGASTDPPN